MKSKMKHRLAAAALAVLGLSLAGVAALSPAIAQPDTTMQATPETKLSVIALKHIGVREFSSAVGGIALDRFSQMQFDSRSNSIVLNATPVSTQKINDLVEILDVLIAEEEGDEEIQVYPLQHAAANHQLLMSLNEVLQDPQRRSTLMRLSMDQSTNQLIARGAPSNLAKLGLLLQQLDKPTQEDAVASDINVRLLWLTSEASDEVPADAADVTEALADMGITGLGLAAQTVVRATNRSQFTSEFMTGRDNAWQIHFAGTAQTSDADTWTMDVSIEGRQAPQQGTGSVEFNTRLTTQSGHFVVLGVSPIGDTDSVFVLQIVEAD